MGSGAVFSPPEAFIADVLLGSKRQPQKLKYGCMVAALNNNSVSRVHAVRRSVNKDLLNPYKQLLLSPGLS